MPKVATYRLDWSPIQEAYILYEYSKQEALPIVPESPEWFVWLEQSVSFAFHGKAGACTVRKETIRKCDRYWYVYQRTGEKLAKRYVGKSVDVTLERLEQVTATFKVEQKTKKPSSQQPPEIIESGTADSVKAPCLFENMHDMES